MARWRRKQVVFVGLLVVTFGLVVYLRAQRKAPSNLSEVWAQHDKFRALKINVCLLGNAPSVEAAQRIHEMWGQRFISVWYIWGISSTGTPPILPSNFHVISNPDAKLSWAEGIQLCLGFLKSHSELFSCDYYFTHDDDLEFYRGSIGTLRPSSSSLENENLEKSKSDFANASSLAAAKGLSQLEVPPRIPGDKLNIDLVLLHFLRRYQPAVVGFPWRQGIRTIGAMQDMYRLFGDAEAQPLTGFDSGMLLYHASVVDFFIPYSPRGEGGFHGHWSLCAHFLNLFAPFVFRQFAVQINTLQYDNLINLDNIPKAQRKHSKQLNPGLVFPEQSRHPYEYRQNEAYTRFLLVGVNPSLRASPSFHWGRTLTPDDVTWEINVQDEISSFENNRLPFMDPLFVRSSLEQVYDLGHDTLANNAYLRAHFPNQFPGRKIFFKSWKSILEEIKH